MPACTGDRHRRLASWCGKVSGPRRFEPDSDGQEGDRVLLDPLQTNALEGGRPRPAEADPLRGRCGKAASIVCRNPDDSPSAARESGGMLPTQSPPGSPVTVLRVLLCDDHALIRSLVRAALNAESDIEVVVEICSAADLLRELPSHAIDVAVLDGSMPGGSGFDVIREAIELSPRLPIVIYTSESDISYVRASLARGARGYVLKDSDPAQLAEAIRTTFAGDIYLDDRLPSLRITGLASSRDSESCDRRTAEGPGLGV